MLKKKFVPDKSKKILITGAAGFIGSYLSKALAEESIGVIGLDNLNGYYDVSLKQLRLSNLAALSSFRFVEGDISDKPFLVSIFKKYSPDIVVNLAAQAGVRYSIDNPDAYIQSNIIGFYNILECCRNYPVEHLLYASSSSVYGGNTKTPFSTEDKTDMPVSLYAATKKSDELIAHAYCKLYGIPSTGLRFFTVYGPMGRPDMAYFSFSEKIMRGEPIQIYNHGDMYRDFTYIDDIITALGKIVYHPPISNENGMPYKIYNIGNSRPEKLMYFIECLEKALGRKAEKEFLPMQPGDVYQTFADVTNLERDFNFKPETSIEEGLSRFAEWFKQYRR